MACETHKCLERNFSWDNLLKNSLVHSAPFMSGFWQKLPNSFVSMSFETKNKWKKFLYYPPIHNSPNISWALITWREKDKSHGTKSTRQALSMGCYFSFPFLGPIVLDCQNKRAPKTLEPRSNDFFFLDGKPNEFFIQRYNTETAHMEKQFYAWVSFLRHWPLDEH